MPRLSLRGEPLMGGIGDGVTGRWITLTDSVRQDCSSGVCRIVRRVEATGFEAAVDGRGANWLQAGGGTWAARYEDGTGYRDSNGHTDPRWLPLEVDAATGAVLVSEYATGRGLWLIWPSGQVQQIADVPLDVQQADIDSGSVAIYRSGGKLIRWPDGEVFPVTGSDARYDRGYLCLNLSGLWFVPWDQPDRALFLSGDGRDFNPDICALSNGLVRVVSSTTQGEGPNDLRTYDINPVLGTVNGKAQPFEDIRVPREAAAVVPNFSPAAIRVLPFDYPCVPNITDVYVWGTFHIGDIRELATVVSEAKAQGKPSLGYYDELFRADRLDAIPASLDVIGINCYPSGDLRKGIAPEPISATVARAKSNILACQKANRLCVMFVAVYVGSGAWNLQYVLDLLRALWDLARETGVDVVPFGIVRTPLFQELTEALNRMLAAAKGRPAPAPKPTSQEPLMIARLAKSRLTPSRTFSGRWLYRLSTGKFLSVDGASGTLRPGGTNTDGDSEAFEWDGKSDRCDIAPGNADGLRFPFGVDLSR